MKLTCFTCTPGDLHGVNGSFRRRPKRQARGSFFDAENSIVGSMCMAASAGRKGGGTISKELMSP